MKFNQGDAVFHAISTIIEIDSSTPTSEQLSKEQRGMVHDRVVAMFQSGETGFRASESNQAKLTNPEKLSAYVSGLINNWLRKDKRLNGGVAYTPKSTRVTDPTLKNLRLLLGNYEAGTSEHQAVSEAISAREAEVVASRPKQTVDFSSIPADLKATLGIE